MAISALGLKSFSVMVLLALVLVFGASAGVFHLLTRRWTRNRRQASIEDWAGEHDFDVAWGAESQLAPPFTGLQLPQVYPQAMLQRDATSICAFSTSVDHGSPQNTWHVLIRRTNRSWTGADLRPAGAARSVVDLFKLSGFPAQLPSERFVIFAAESRAAKSLAQSSVGGLLPPDVGLLVYGSYVVLDFSNRPFDSVEFDRMLSVVEQVLVAEF